MRSMSLLYGVMKVLKILGAVFCAIGAAMLVAAIVLYINSKSFADSAARADGVVVDLAWHGESYHPVVEYATRDGEAVAFHSSVGSSPPAYDVGERVTVLYDPA